MYDQHHCIIHTIGQHVFFLYFSLFLWLFFFLIWIKCVLKRSKMNKCFDPDKTYCIHPMNMWKNTFFFSKYFAIIEFIHLYFVNAGISRRIFSIWKKNHSKFSKWKHLDVKYEFVSIFIELRWKTMEVSSPYLPNFIIYPTTHIWLRKSSTLSVSNTHLMTITRWYIVKSIWYEIENVELAIWNNFKILLTPKKTALYN